MKNVLALTVIAGTAAIASALPTLPTVTWTVSQDGGATWLPAAVLSAAGSVMVRGQLSWTELGQAPVGLGAAIVSFDGRLTGVNGSDSATAITKTLVPVGDTQTLAYSAVGGAGKIDVDTDAAGAGAGTGWVATGQGTQQGIGSAFNSANPVTFITYNFNIGGADHLVAIDSILNSTANQAVRIYLTAAGGTSGGGQFSRAGVLVNGATVALVTPTPGSLALLGLGGLAAARRRR